MHFLLPLFLMKVKKEDIQQCFGFHVFSHVMGQLATTSSEEKESPPEKTDVATDPKGEASQSQSSCSNFQEKKELPQKPASAPASPELI